jgi:hypothetical protein
MRIFTEKDKKALVVAFKRFGTAMSGMKLKDAEWEAILVQALAEGLTVDQLLNKENWARALKVSPELTPAEYVDILCERRITVRDLKDEPLWYDTDTGNFRTVAEAAHDFFMNVTGKGGKWNVPSALVNLQKVIGKHSLQAVLSEELIAAVTGGAEMNYFNYVAALDRDFNSLPVDNSLTAEQQERLDEEEKILSAAVDTVEVPEIPEAPAKPSENNTSDATEFHDEPEPEQVIEQDFEGVDLREIDPEPEDQDYDARSPYSDDDRRNTSLLIPDPRETKRTCIGQVLFSCTPEQLQGFLRIVTLGKDKESERSLITMTELVDYLTDGQFDTAAEDPATRDCHMQINGDLANSFLACMRSQRISMSEADIDEIDFLHDSWDFRDPFVRRLSKLRRLIRKADERDVDGDVQDALSDLEKYYDSQA